MLPPKEFNTTCLRCGAALALEHRYCACGADRELELAVAGEINPAISVLQRWLAALAGIELVSLAVSYVYMRFLGAPGEFSSIAVPGLIQAASLFLLCLVARFLPLGASLLALALFATHLGLALLADPLGVVSPGPILLLRLLFLFVVVGAVHAGWTARGLRARAQDAFPSAVAIFRDPAARAAGRSENR
ncbi:MAG TPA: hypothetical protein VNO33_05825 [Kofleriaceae bacterium]|nr:hypothetical protein [Kofleriaceae bacterium]